MDKVLERLKLIAASQLMSMLRMLIHQIHTMMSLILMITMRIK